MRRLIDDMTPAQQAYHLTFNRTHWVRNTYFPIDNMMFNQHTAAQAVFRVNAVLANIGFDPRSS